ncbi:MAG: hypothetical protein ACTSPQ_21250, partial [Candidatus Helarchaeota archaeon]
NILQHFKKSFFLINISRNKKSPSANAKGLGIDKLPLLDTFRTFCWGEIIEELQNTYKLKALISHPISAIINV